LKINRISKSNYDAGWVVTDLDLGTAYDKEALLIYANISQIFRIWFIPFHKAPVTFVTVIELAHDARTGKYYIKSQDDLYQVDQWVLFLPGLGAHALVWLWQMFVSWQCLLLCYVFWPVTWFEENVFKNGWKGLLNQVHALSLMDSLV